MRKRTKLFVDRQLQGTLVFRLLVHWCAMTVCMFLFTFMLTLMAHMFSHNELSFGEMVRGFLQRYLLFVLVLGALAPLFLWDIIKTSHRIAGPVCRLRRELDELAQGRDAELVEFRDTDFWTDLASNFNAVRHELLWRRSGELARPAIGEPAHPSTTDTVGDDAEIECDIAALG